MCDFFSCIATKDGQILFCEDDSHETIIERAKIKDDGGNFVRIEYTDEKGMKVDQAGIPEWYERCCVSIEMRTRKIYKIIAPALEDYEKIIAHAREDYEKIIAHAREDYEKTEAPAREDYKKIEAPALEDYKKIKAHAREDYDKIEAHAWKNYKSQLQKVEGYVPTKAAENEK